MATATRKPVKPTADVKDPTLIPVESGVEVWRNCTPGMTFITRIGEYGKRETELVYGERTFSVTPAERRLNQNNYAGPELDLFTNGTFQPVSLIDGEPDTARLLQNPNTLTDEDIQQVLAMRGEIFVQRINDISSEAVLTRVLEMAREPRYEVTLAQYEALKLRQMDLKGDLDVAPPPAPDPNTGTLPRAVTPR
jgi:hypothetical protein